MSKITKIISGVVLVVILAGAGYLYYADTGGALLSTSALPGSDSATTSSATGPERDQTLQRLNRLEDISINTDFLSAQVFTSFKNFGISIQSQPVGRENPFIPPEVQIPATITDDQADFPATSTAPQQPESSAGEDAATTSIEQLPSTGDATTTDSATTTTSATSS